MKLFFSKTSKNFNFMWTVTPKINTTQMHPSEFGKNIPTDQFKGSPKLLGNRETQSRPHTMQRHKKYMHL